MEEGERETMAQQIDATDRLIAIGCADIADFLDTYYRHDRYRGRGEEYAADLLASAQEYFERYGHTLISRHDSTLGQAVWYYGTAADAALALHAEAEVYADRAAHFEGADAEREMIHAQRLTRQAHEMERLAALGTA